MTDYVNEANKAAEQYLTAVAKVQDDFVKTIAEFVKHAPKAPEGFELPKIDLPTVDLPTPADVTTVTFDFAEKLIAQQCTYAQNLIAVLTPAAV